MKRIFFALALALTVMSMSARDRLFINDFSISPGESKTISVMLANDTTYCALQTDIILPAGLTIDLDDGVKTNYPKFYPLVEPIKGLDSKDD